MGRTRKRVKSTMAGARKAQGATRGRMWWRRRCAVATVTVTPIRGRGRGPAHTHRAPEVVLFDGEARRLEVAHDLVLRRLERITERRATVERSAHVVAVGVERDLHVRTPREGHGVGRDVL